MSLVTWDLLSSKVAFNPSVSPRVRVVMEAEVMESAVLTAETTAAVMMKIERVLRLTALGVGIGAGAVEAGTGVVEMVLARDGCSASNAGGTVVELMPATVTTVAVATEASAW